MVAIVLEFDLKLANEVLIAENQFSQNMPGNIIPSYAYEEQY